VERITNVYATSTLPSNTPCSRAAISRFFTGLDIVPPYQGAAPELTFAGLWDCENVADADSEGSRAFYVAVGRKQGAGR
jgi:hypothetical protein